MITKILNIILKSVLLIVAILYFGYCMYYEGYIASDMNTYSCIDLSIKQILSSESSPKEKKELIEKVCFYSYSEITIRNLSNKTVVYKKESGFINKSFFNELSLYGDVIETKYGDYLMEYKTYIPKFYISVRYNLLLGKNMTRI